MSNRDFCQIEAKEEPPEPAEAQKVSSELQRALDVMAAFSRNQAPKHEVKQTGSYTVVKPLREVY